jgi:hypothetical protein
LAEPYPFSNGWQAFILAYDLQNQGADTPTIARAVFAFVIGTGDPILWGVLTRGYSTIMSAWSPPGTCGDKAYLVMDQETRGAPGLKNGDSIEITFEGPNPSTGALPFVEFVDAAINTISAATSTVLVGWLALRFTAGTRAALGMQQWDRCCSVEISTLLNIPGLPEVLSSLIDLGYEMGGKPHWGQRNDGLMTQGNATIYSRLPEWRAAYARLSGNLEHRTFENAFSVRWQLTTPGMEVVAVSPGSLPFGNVPIGESATRDIVVTNNSFLSLPIIWGMLQPGGVFSVSAPPGNALGPKQSVTAQVTVNPTATGSLQNQLIIATSIPYAESVQVPLSVTGIPVPTVVPNVVGDLAADAVNAIRARGLNPLVQHGADPTCKHLGHVLSQSPQGGTPEQLGGSVGILVGISPPHGCP